MNFEDCKKYNATHRCYNISMWFPFLGGAKFFGLLGLGKLSIFIAVPIGVVLVILYGTCV